MDNPDDHPDHPDNCQCYNCRLEQAEHDVLKAMNRVEELKRKKEKQNELSDSKTV